MNKKAWYALSVLAVVIIGAWFATGSSFKGSYIPSERPPSIPSPFGSSDSPREERRGGGSPEARRGGGSPEAPATTLATTSTGYGWSPEAAPVNDNINRAQLAMLIGSALDQATVIKVNGNTYMGAELPKYTNCANDLPMPPGQFTNVHNVICYLVAKGIMGTYSDGSFKPFAPVTRAEAAKIFGLAFDPLSPQSLPNPTIYADVKVSDWFYSHVRWLVEAKVADVASSPANKFNPGVLLTNGRAIYWMNNVKKNVAKSKWNTK